MAEDIVASGKADFIGMGRPSLCDPIIRTKLKTGTTRISGPVSAVCRMHRFHLYGRADPLPGQPGTGL
jgi:2,4-dienoyl-CoA reductase-like NADH-dependent reductase (Old Yellow Enzyme family)